MQIQYRELSDFDFHQPNKLINHNVKHRNSERKTYIPYEDLNQRELPKLIDITFKKERIYLKPQQLKVLTSSSTNINQMDSMKEKLNILEDYEPKVGILDLGTAPLQRIINDMKSISQIGQDDHIPCRKTDLVMKYCAYLQGNEQNKLNNKAIRNKNYINTPY